MIKSNDKIYIGSSKYGYLDESMMSVVYKYLMTHEVYEKIKISPRKIKDDYLLEIDVNEYTRKLMNDLRTVDKIKLYKRTHSWDEIEKMGDGKVRSS